MDSAIAARPAQTAISRPLDAQRRLSAIKTLTGLAEARQAAVSAETLTLYSAHLAEFEPADVVEVIRALARRKRAEGETAFPALGELTEPLQAIRRRRNEAQRIERGRQKLIEEFWRNVPFWIEVTGQSEEQILERHPSFKGTKPR